jgi:predicted dehydrogenase
MNDDPLPALSENALSSVNRRHFLRQIGAAGLGLAASGGIADILRAETAPAIASGLNPSSKIRFAVVGTNSRGLSHIGSIAKLKNAEIAYVCDVDDRSIAKGMKEASRHALTPATAKDFRKVLDDKNVDAITIATPDHWHTPMTILALAAGKHVYVEKPCSHNPHEGEMIVAATKKAGLLVQMGNQRRSFPNVRETIKEIHDGIIGRAYFGRTWYTNNRVSIGHGKPVAVPSELDYDLWQGPAPRKPYMSNLIHYNWHWFWNYGTGEALNNGTHEYDICRWALGAELPIRVNSNGGRYAYDDDWETPDTQTINLDFDGGKSISWEGRSCNKYPEENLERGVLVYGTNGTALIDGNNCTIYDAKNKVVKSVKGEKAEVDPSNTLSSTGATLDAVHFANFADALRDGVPLNSPVEEANKSVTGLQLGNIAWRVQRELRCDGVNGRIQGDDEAMKLWQRSYEPGWEPKV